jgi:hypothetical protein
MRFLPLAALAAALTLPTAADAATVSFSSNGSGGSSVFYAGAPNEVNNVRISFTAAGIVIDDQVRITALDSGCAISSAGDATCPGSAKFVSVNGRDKNDTITYTAPHRGQVIGGSGADTIVGGTRRAGFGRAIEPVIYQGKESTSDTTVDTVTYRQADRGVAVDLSDTGGSFDDGRPGDLEGITSDIEVIEGSNFGDTLVGSPRGDTFRGLNGNDTISSGGGSDLIDEGSAANGADTIDGGSGAGDSISYGARTSGVAVSLDGVRDDGGAGERDDVRATVERVTGTSFADTLIGNSGPNTLTGGSGPDSLLGEGGNDVIFARDGFEDAVACGTGTDTAQLDSRDVSGGCEDASVSNVGRLRLAPATLEAKAGRVTRLRLSWRHPVSWRSLRSIELRLGREGRITIRPGRQRISAGGAVSLVRTRLTTDGKAVTARLAVRLDDSLAGRTLTAEVAATDRRGRRQLNRAAGTVIVAG